MNSKAVISTVASVLLSVWYLAAIVGFDVHTDHHDGEIFVVSLLGNTDCESIHPEDVCHCMDHHSGHCDLHDEDCENEIGTVTITGDGYEFVFNALPDVSPILGLTASVLDGHSGPDRNETVLFQTPPRQRLFNLCVLRV